MTTRTKFIAIVVTLLIAFLIGFVPQYLDKIRIRGELLASNDQVTSLQSATKMAEVRDACGMSLLEVLRQNYGLAREHSTQYFDKLREAVDDASNPLREPLRGLLDKRDSVVALLAQSDPASSAEVLALCGQTYEITRP